MYDGWRLKFSLQRLKCHPQGFIPFSLPTNEIVVEMLWENRLSFHNLLSISGGKKVEKRWEILFYYNSIYEIVEMRQKATLWIVQAYTYRHHSLFPHHSPIQCHKPWIRHSSIFLPSASSHSVFVLCSSFYFHLVLIHS